MYLLVAGKPNGSVEYYGPFGTEERAKTYAQSLTDTQRWHVVPLIIPYSVVKQIVWRSNDN